MTKLTLQWNERYQKRDPKQRGHSDLPVEKPRSHADLYGPHPDEVGQDETLVELADVVGQQIHQLSHGGFAQGRPA